MSHLKLWLIRHGETEINCGRWSDKPAETCLTPLGKEQAQKAAQKIIEPPDLLIKSPLIRAKQTADFILNQWPNTLIDTWPIEEFIYLSPSRLHNLSKLAKRRDVEEYWQKNDPYYCDGKDAESFADFLKRVKQFHHQIIQQQGFVIVIGHGQFLKAFQFGLSHGFNVSPEWMSLFRQTETANPLKNGEIVRLNLSNLLDFKSLNQS
ncbi:MULTISPECIES: phosphoglycerate mutase family protein [Legionella]|uniref:2,3-bisphosphoglycerate-dependent phosphoglycerate mutase n=1 Tax=Legionella drozanskii LLAP-1 TaxID=1212489 RepID=A0A0W0TBJ3_9GAMM|nr:MULTISPECIES: histidine phosphatase family protein [Legionella]KTC92939.1 2,3-bisphosphoglycerate-dependent phosphoglycerate mutase [Legionella drozanskii LLAP-1]PJE13119.1 MAG: histidine phosphatase family protein [Legionella sp.]